MADNADQTNDQTGDKAPEKTTMPRAVHELVTGKKPEDMVPARTLITDAVMTKHKLDGKTIAALTASGAIENVEVLKA